MAREPINQDDEDDEIRPISDNDDDEAPQARRRGGNRVIDDIANNIAEEKLRQGGVVPARDYIKVDLAAVLGSTSLKINNLLKIGRGAVIEFDQSIDDPIELTINNKAIARAQVVVKGDKLAVVIKKLLKK